MTGVDGFLLEKGKNGDYGYRRYETLEEVRDQLPKDEYESIKAKFDTDEEEEKEIYELSRRRKVIWIPAEKIMKLVQIENVTKEVLEDIENNIKSGNEDKIYVTSDGELRLKYVYDSFRTKLKEKEIGCYSSAGWPSKKTQDEKGIYTIDPSSHRGRHLKAYGGPPLGFPLIS